MVRTSERDPWGDAGKLKSSREVLFDKEPVEGMLAMLGSRLRSEDHGE